MFAFSLQKGFFTPNSREVPRRSIFDRVCHSLPLKFVGRISVEHGLLVLDTNAQASTTVHGVQIRG